MEFSRLEPLRQDEEFVLYRGQRSDQPGSRAVLLLAPASTRPALETLKKIEHEYSLRDELDSAWAVRPVALCEQSGQTTLVLEDPGGETLDRFLPGPLEMPRFLCLAIGIAKALSGLHKNELIHKDVKPANVLVNPAAGEVRLMGFGIASRLARERQTPETPEFIAGTLPYMAPEQTGRMNRSIDSRSDLYALGVTLYQMLTGSLPFAVTDPIELVHCHIARQPVPPADQMPGIPRQVSAIVMKLLAKAAEERYQTAAGAASDLRRCLDEWETRGWINEFSLGEQDLPDRLLIAEKLYGRESEINTLLATFDRIVAGGRPELVLVSGYSGIGKSSVVNELQKRLVPHLGLFASGKFDQYKRDVPYATLAQAFVGLLRPLLAKSDAELSKWRGAFLEALDLNARLMTDLIPELKLIIGDQPLVPELEPQLAQSRFQLVLRRFIGIFAQPEHPLALFLDDLQWLDAATLDLLEDLLTRSDLQHLLLIGAYRDNEVDSAHPLMRKLDAIRQAGSRVQEIHLAPLVRDDLEQLIADALHCQPECVVSLAQLVYEKTAGNPFFVIQFLYSLAEEGLLYFDHGFDHKAACWSWDLGRIHDKGYTDNVVDLMVGKLTRLRTETKQALQEFACLGNVTAIGRLAVILGAPEDQVHTALWPAVRQELIERREGHYRFIHDRVQEAAYSLIPEPMRPEIHLRIGRLLVTQTPPERWEDAIFEIVGQLNRGSALIARQEERDQLAGLNLLAGLRAKASTAYASALAYLNAASALLAEDSWECRPEQIFALELNRAECEFLTGELVAAEQRLAAISVRAATTVERASVTCLRANLYTTLDQSDRAVAVCLDYLRKMGIDWSPHPAKEDVRREYERIWSLLGARTIEELIDLPLMEDPASLATVDVLIKLMAPARATDADLACLTICKAVSLSLERGNCDASCYAYVELPSFAGPRFGDYQAGFRFGQLGYELVERRGLKRFEANTYFSLSLYVVRWTKHVRACRDLLHRAFEAANRIGDLPYATYTCTNLNTDLLFAGEPLPVVQSEAEHGLAFAEKAQFGLVIDFITTQLAVIRMLRGFTPKFGCFDDGQFNELRMEYHLSSNPALAIAACWYWIRKLQARYIAGDYSTAMDAASKAQPLLWTSCRMFEEAEYHFYGALTRAASYDSAPADERQQYVDGIAAHQRQLQLWAEDCPENFENRAALVGAEIARIEGRNDDAMQLYEEAIRSARTNCFFNNEAIAHERASGFYRSRGFDQIADLYLRNARYCYSRWGADGKVRQLEEVYPRLRTQEPALPPTSTITTSVEDLDLATVLKVSQAVSGQIVLEKLIDVLLRTVMEHSGAERGLLILQQGAELRVQAKAIIQGDSVSIVLADDPVSSAQLAETVVQYAARTRESVILEDASARGTFSNDEYIGREHARSILCLPLIKQGRLIALLYLENKLAANAFTPAGISVLNVIASAAAVSLENSRLYREVQEREAKIRRLVDAEIIGVGIWDFEGRIIEANDAFLHMVGYDREDLVSDRLRWTDLTPAEWHNRDAQILEELRVAGQVQHYEKEFFRKDGSRVPVLIGVATFQKPGNQGVAFVLDLTERKRAEEALHAMMTERSRVAEFRAEIGMALAREGSLRGILQSCAEAMVQHLDAAFARIWTLSADGRELQLQASAGLYIHLDGPHSRIPFGQFKIGLIALERKPHLTNDIQNDPRVSDKDWARRENMISFAGWPLIADDRVVGVVGMFSRRPLPESTPGNLLLAADGIAQVIERKHAEEALRNSEAYLAEAQMLSQTGSFGWVPSSGELIWSSETFRIFDYEPAIKPTLEMVFQRVHPEDRPLVYQFIDQASRAGHDWNLDHRLLMPDGSVKHLHVVAHDVKNDSSGEVSFVGAVMDVTAAKQSQQDLEQAFREIKTLKDQLQSENIVLREEIDKASMFEQIVGTSPPLRKVLSRIAKVAPTDSSVLITGETGTGKELVARAIHRRSRRSSRAFVSVNCAAVPRDLIASELFGHEKGAFTGATQRRLGRFELAEGGTIFLDEVGELPAETQIALLRVLQEREFERIGGTGSIATDVRVIAATNRDLEAAIAAGTFRSDLFYRLNVFPIEVPSLRERREDIPLLVEYFIDRFARQAGKSFQAVNKKSLDLLQSYPWPGNIRELQNVIERSVIVCETENFSVDESWLSRRPLATEPNRGTALLRRLPSEEKAVIEAALRETGGRVYGPSGAAAKLGIPRSTLESKIRSLKINKNPLKPTDRSKNS